MRTTLLCCGLALAAACAPAASPDPTPIPAQAAPEIRTAAWRLGLGRWDVEVTLPRPAAVVLLAEVGSDLVRLYPGAAWPSDVRPAGIASVTVGAPGPLGLGDAFTCCCCGPWRPWDARMTPSVHASVGALSNLEQPRLNERLVGGTVFYRVEASTLRRTARPPLAPSIVIAVHRPISAWEVDAALRGLDPQASRAARLDALARVLGGDRVAAWGEVGAPAP